VAVLSKLKHSLLVGQAADGADIVWCRNVEIENAVLGRVDDKRCVVDDVSDQVGMSLGD